MRARQQQQEEEQRERLAQMQHDQDLLKTKKKEQASDNAAGKGQLTPGQKQITVLDEVESFLSRMRQSDAMPELEHFP